MQEDIQLEVRRRADAYLPQTHLITDYYRIRRRIAYPLPVSAIHLPATHVEGIGNYPWATWMTWELEERIHSLGWAGTWFDDAEARARVATDLEALSGWPCYRQWPGPDLSLGHSPRCLWAPHHHWAWLDDGLRRKMEGAFERIVEDGLPRSDADVTRLRGSRGHLTLTAHVEPHPAVWWVFGLGDRAPSGVKVEGSGSLIVDGMRFDVEAEQGD